MNNIWKRVKEGSEQMQAEFRTCLLRCVRSSSHSSPQNNTMHTAGACANSGQTFRPWVVLISPYLIRWTLGEGGRGGAQQTHKCSSIALRGFVVWPIGKKVESMHTVTCMSAKGTDIQHPIFHKSDTGRLRDGTAATL